MVNTESFQKVFYDSSFHSQGNVDQILHNLEQGTYVVTGHYSGDADNLACSQIERLLSPQEFIEALQTKYKDYTLEEMKEEYIQYKLTDHTILNHRKLYTEQQMEDIKKIKLEIISRIIDELIISA